MEKAIPLLFQEAFKGFFSSEKLKSILLQVFPFQITLCKEKVLPSRAVSQILIGRIIHFTAELADMPSSHPEKFIHNVITHVYQIQGSTHFYQEFFVCVCLYSLLINVLTLFRFP